MPAPFGIVIGDEIVHDYFVQTRSPYQLKASSLPQKSKLNYWLNLKNVEITEKENRQGTEVHLKLTYQTFYAPLSVKELEIPPFSLEFQAMSKDKVQSFQIPKWQFLMTPLHDIKLRKVNGKFVIRPDQRPNIFSLTTILFALVILGTSIFIGVIYLLYYYAIWPFHKKPNRPFKRVLNLLKTLEKQAISGQDKTQQAALALHQGFNEAHGKPLFANQLEGFFRAHPQYKPLRGDIHKFFQNSQEFFFANKIDQVLGEFSLQRMKQLCALLNQKERGI